jgi:serine/threonine protein kinase
VEGIGSLFIIVHSTALRLCMLRDVTHNACVCSSLHNGSARRAVKLQSSRVPPTRMATASNAILVALLLLTLFCGCSATSGSVDAAQTAASAAETIPVASLPSHYDPLSFSPMTGGEVALQYTFGGINLVLVLSEDGFLHAYNLESGELAWSADVGGDMIAVEVDLPPSREAILRDPLALPFLVRGNSLFTRTPFYTYNPASSSTLDTMELLDNLPEMLRPYFFMNISTLLRRQTVSFGGTDIFVTTSVDVSDLDGSSGQHVNRQTRGGGGLRSNQRRRHAPTVQRNASSLHNELLPVLHVVRYNIVLHVVKADEYSWSITLSQLQLSPRTSFSAMYRHAAGRTPTREAEPKEYNGEGHPRFFSHVMRGLLDYDAEHREKHRVGANGNGGASASANLDEKVAFPPETTRAALVEALERRRAEVAEYVSRSFTVQQLNRSHIRLHNSLEGTATWTAALPSSPRGTGVSSSVLLEEEGRGDAAGSNDDHEAEPPQSSCASTHAIASYVWVSGADQVYRIPIQHAPLPSDAPAEAADNYSVNVASPSDVARASSRQRLRLVSTSSSAGTVVSRQHGVDGLQLVPFLHQSSRSADMSHTVMVMDVEADEREGEELDRYYRELRWWESPGPAHNTVDNPMSSFSSTGDVVRMGLPWRTAGIISFHVLCLAGSIAFLCAGVPPRNQLQRAWAQADRNRDRLSHTSASRPQSTQLMPQDLLGNGLGSAASPFSPLMDGFSVDSPRQAPMDSILKTRSLSSARLDEGEHNPTDGAGGAGGHEMRGGGCQSSQEGSDAPPHHRDDRTPEEVHAVMREDGDEKVARGTSDGSTAASTGEEGNLLTSSLVIRQSRHCPADCLPPPAASEERRLVQHPALAQSLSSKANNNGTDKGGHAAAEDDDDDDSEEIDMGERWWVRAQNNQPRLPSVATLEETLSDHTSSMSFSPVHRGYGDADVATEEEGKLFQLHFKVLEKIGFGGEGCVFCVEHRVTHARYAIKAILIHEQDEERVVQEAVLHSSFDNANVVRFYFCWIEDIAVSTADRLQLCNVGEDGLDTMSVGFSDPSLAVSSPADDTLIDDDKDESVVGDTYHMLFIQMEYFPRGTLADWLRSRKGFYRLEVLRFMQNIADGLSYLHNQDVVHRDLKPTNIFVSNASVLKIGDFGLAKRRIATTNSTVDLASNVAGTQQERSVVGGSPLYCSPEQTRGDPVNKPSDIFSFGIIAVEMLCTFATLHERIRILTDAHQGVLPAEIERDFPEEVQIIRPLLASEPQQRPQLRKVQRQLSRLIGALEDSEQDGDDVPHSPAETLEPSQLLSVSAASPIHAQKATEAPASTLMSGSMRLPTVDVFSDNDSPLLRTSAAAQPPITKKPATANIVRPHDLHVAAASFPLSATLVTQTLPNEEGRTCADVQSLPEWQVDDVASSLSGNSPCTAHSSLRQQQRQLPQRPTRRSSPSSVHSSGFFKHRNSYHDRRYTSSSSSPAAELTAATAAARSSSPETASQGGVSLAAPAELIVTDPYGPPTMPVTYLGDTDLSSILKRDLQDRTISPPD